MSPYFPIHGVLPPVITPFTPAGEVDFDAFTANLERFNAHPLAGYLVLGSNGETPYLSTQDKLRLVGLTARHAAPGRIIMAGTGLESTRATLELTRAAAHEGAQCALVLTPSYYGDQMDDAAQMAYFSTLADGSPIPILIYNVTKFTHVNISPTVVSALSHHPNIIGMKDSSGNIAQLTGYQVAGLAPEFNLMVGTASAWYPALCIGIKAAVMALANCCPGECAGVQSLYEAGDHEGALALYRRMFPVNACVTGRLGVPALKHACDLLGYEGGLCAPPLLPLTQSQRTQVADVLKAAGLTGPA